MLIGSDPLIEELIARSNAVKNDPPSARALHDLHNSIRDGILKAMSKRGEVCERNLRQVVQKRKESRQLEQEEQAARAEADARKREKDRVKIEKDKIKKEKDEDAPASVKKKEKVGKMLSRKRSHDEMEVDEEKEHRESLPSVGAHGLARQDGVGIHEGTSLRSVSVLVHSVFTCALCHCDDLTLAHDIRSVVCVRCYASAPVYTEQERLRRNNNGVFRDTQTRSDSVDTSHQLHATHGLHSRQHVIDRKANRSFSTRRRTCSSVPSSTTGYNSHRSHGHSCFTFRLRYVSL